MKLTRVTITGADNNTNISDLVSLTNDYPFVEWGILFSKKREGQPRFPGKTWLHDLTGNTLPISAHLCGEYVREFVTDDFSFKRERAFIFPYFDRIQLNFAGIKPIFDKDIFVKILRENLEKQFILQCDDENDDLLAYTAEKGCNTVPLFDKSGGKGIKPDEWPQGVSGRYCGYAGGLNVSNIREELDKISIVSKDCWFWVDMENGVRKEDRLDLDLVKEILEICKPLVEEF